MSILGNDLLLAGTDEGYNLTRSLRFRSSASASLSRTPASAGNRQKFTYSAWIKLGNFSSTTYQTLMYTYASTSDVAGIYFDANRLTILAYNGGSLVSQLVTTQLFRDPSAWYHIVISVDTTQATDTNRVKMYVNGSQITALALAIYPPQNTNYLFNAQYVTRIAATDYPGNPNYFDGYMTEINWIDGQQLTPSSFGSTNTLTGVWQPARYTGTYGTNGFYLPFTDNSALTTSSNVGLGKDFSGNGNYWTTNNISITSGTTYDSMTDVPTLTSATAANFCIANPLDKQTDISVTQGNLQISTTAGAGNKQIRGSIALPSSGKFYWETKNTGSVNNFSMGLTTLTASLSTEGAGDMFYNEGGVIGNNGTNTSGYATLALNDTVGVAVDIDANKIYWYKNNTLVNSGGTTINITAPFAPMFGLYDNGNAQSITFGQRPFTYTPPTGYVALNTYNLPTSTIVKGNTVMDATIWTGDGSSPRTITNSAGFKPDLVWAKNRSTSGYWNVLFDSVRGVGNQLSSNQTDAELASASNVAGKVSAFNSNGFSLATGSSSIRSVNGSAETYVGWQWQAGQGTTSSNTSGTITSTVSVNASAGFSIITYTGNSTSGATVGHGLGVAPKFFVIKRRDFSGNWKAVSTVTGSVLMGELNTQSVWSSPGAPMTTAPTSTVITLDAVGDRNGSGQTYVIYAFAEIDGFSKITYFDGNGSTDGPFVYTGFRPKFTLSKDIEGGSYWAMMDSTRNQFNVASALLNADLPDAESTSAIYDYLSNGIKLRSATNNQSNHKHIIISFAENPFKNALAR